MSNLDPTLQPTYEMCFVCGVNNPIGLKVEFHNQADYVSTEFTPREEHQGYPGFMHGGILGTLLDETIGRAAYLRNTWVMTGRLEVRYHSLVKIGETVKITGEVVKDRGKALLLRGEARLGDGKLVAEASGTFIKLPDDMLKEVEQIVMREPSR